MTFRAGFGVLTRREILAAAACFTLSPRSVRQAGGQEPPRKDSDPLPPLNRFSRMVQEYFVDQVREVERQSLDRKHALQTAADAEAYVQDVRKRIRMAFGPEPERTPLNARVTGTVEREAYRIEKVIFESRPGLLVTANLYLPRDRQEPRPGVVGSCGHSVNGKAAEAYQSFAQGLARRGYVVLIFDPIGQGERLQYVDEQGKPRRGVGTAEHLYAGNQQFLVGEFFGAWRAWDGVRALDYLLTRPEVDPRHVGITGNSGGGTMTTWLCGVEGRWTMGAPSCFVTTFRRNLENELPADTEQCPPRALALGLDHDDFLAAMAPKPIIVLGKERDFFDVRGTQEAFERLKRLYSLLGKPDNIRLFVGPTDHGYSQENREAMYGWFDQVTGNGVEPTEPPMTIEKDETLQCTPRGQVAELGARTVFSFTRERALEQAQQRPKLTGESLRREVANALRLPHRDRVPDFRILRPLPGRRYPSKGATTYAVETEPGIHALVTRLYPESHYSRPPRGTGRAILYVAHHSSDAELRDEPLVRELQAAEPTAAFYACDVRGVGESRPDTCGANQFLNPYGSDYFYAIHALMLDRPYVGQKTYDVWRVLDWLVDLGHTDVHLAGLGWGTIPAAFAALLADPVRQVTLKRALPSYLELATNEAYDWPLSAFIPGVLARFDLPDIYAELQSKQFRSL